MGLRDHHADLLHDKILSTNPSDENGGSGRVSVVGSEQRAHAAASVGLARGRGLLMQVEFVFVDSRRWA